MFDVCRLLVPDRQVNWDDKSRLGYCRLSNRMVEMKRHGLLLAEYFDRRKNT